MSFHTWSECQWFNSVFKQETFSQKLYLRGRQQIAKMSCFLIILQDRKSVRRIVSPFFKYLVTLPDINSSINSDDTQQETEPMAIQFWGLFLVCFYSSKNINIRRKSPTHAEHSDWQCLTSKWIAPLQIIVFYKTTWQVPLWHQDRRFTWNMISPTSTSALILVWLTIQLRMVLNANSSILNHIMRYALRSSLYSKRHWILSSYSLWHICLWPDLWHGRIPGNFFSTWTYRTLKHVYCSHYFTDYLVHEIWYKFFSCLYRPHEFWWWSSENIAWQILA